ncbi:MAG: hypothetical protein M3Y82_13855 [Verrucomicrobiota bacterium]|nr:hypothetical protein [Verrucomicrobiota bacterium]
MIFHSAPENQAMSRMEFLVVLCIVMVLIDLGSRYSHREWPFAKSSPGILPATNPPPPVAIEPNTNSVRYNLETNTVLPATVSTRPIRSDLAKTLPKRVSAPGPGQTAQLIRMPDGRIVRSAFPPNPGSSAQPIRIAVP